MHFLFLSKVLVNKPPPASPAGPLWRELLIYRAFLHISQIPHKNLSKQIFPFSRKTLGKEHLSMFPSSGERLFPEP